MRPRLIAGFALTALVIGVPLGVAAQLVGSSPMHFDGHGMVEASGYVLVIASPGHEVWFNFTMDSGSGPVNHTRSTIVADTPAGDPVLHERESPQNLRPAHGRVSTMLGHENGSALIVGPVNVIAPGSSAFAELSTPVPRLASDLSGRVWDAGLVRSPLPSNGLTMTFKGWAMDRWIDSSLDGRGAGAEWTGATTTCVDVPSPCLSAAGSWTESPVPRPLSLVAIQHRSWISVATLGPGWTLEGSPTHAYLILDELSISLSGTARLPLATATDCPQECPEAGRTLTMSGNLQFHNVTATEDGRLRAEVTGDADWLRVDEEWISPEVLLGAGATAAAAAGVAAVFLLAKLLIPLFTRISADKALEHPRRKLLQGYIEENPGSTFRELIRETGIPTGTARHHLTIMRRSGLIMERRHKATLRFFENHGKFEQTWDAQVLLREPELAAIHAFVAANDGCMQKQILEAFDAQGWSRSTIQHRLQRLVQGGIVTFDQIGRTKRYHAHDTVRQVRDRPVWLGLDTPSWYG